MASGYQSFLSGLGDAGDSGLSTDESASDGAGGGGSASSAASAPAGAGASGGPGWDTVLATTMTALPVIAGKAADAYRTYEESHGGIPHAGGGSSGSSGGGSAHPSAPSRPWYESPTFLIGAGIGLVLAIVTFTRRK